MGALYGVAVCCQSPMHAEFFDLDLLVVTIGFGYFFCGLGYLLGSPVVIAVSNATGRYEHVFYISAASYAVAALSLAFAAGIRKWRHIKRTPEKSVMIKLMT